VYSGIGVLQCAGVFQEHRGSTGVYGYMSTVTSRQAKTVSALYGWPTDLSARRVRLRRD